jgi:dTDP-4-dehydrorhamnose reductase
VRKILLIGKNGQVGWELQRTLAGLGNMVVMDRQQMDLADPDSIRKIVRDIRPGLIVNAAAYTDVDKAESEPDLATSINAIAPGILAEEVKRLNAAVIHYSTDYVFDGSQKRPYTEDDAPNPLNVYGKTKLAGESAIQAVGVPHLILRTSWVYGARGGNFLLKVLKLAREKGELRIIDDQFGAPTWCRTIAEITSQMLAQYYFLNHRPSASISDISGIYHVVSGGLTSWHGFAKKILEYVSKHTSQAVPKLMPISTHDYLSPAKRPHNSSMSHDKLKDKFGLVAPSWEQSLMLCLEEAIKPPLI